MTPWLVLSASPRSRGNSEYAATLVTTALREGGALVELVRLYEYTVAPCVACGLCNSAPGACSLDEAFTGRKDHAALLLERLRSAAGVVVVSPVYFYGVPAQFKALIDRSQRYWRFAEDGEDTNLKAAYALVLAARTHGERLFDGTLMTLRPFLRLNGFSLTGHLPVRGLDGPEELMGQTEVTAQIRSWAQDVLQTIC